MIGLFKRIKGAPKPLPEDELARRLTAPGYRCACCDEVVDAAYAVRLRAPFGWPDPPAPEPDSALEGLGGQRDIITENFARRARDWLVRCYLPIPVKGTPDHVFLSVWVSLSLGHHARFRSAQIRGDADQLGDLFSWLYNRLPPSSGPILTKGLLVPQAGGLTPFYWITDEKHPLYPAQQEGLTAHEIAELYAELGAQEVLQHLKA
ncbi:MAG: DUF2199 domain-containing protein [Roseicyclus sp.]